MRLKALLIRILIVFAFIGLASFMALTFRFNSNDFFQSSPEPSAPNVDLPEQEEMAAGIPVRIRIPAIDIDAPVESLGLTPQGDMDAPKGPDNVAWFNLGTRPGENGSAVITGHYGTWKNGQESVFDDLHKLRQGDEMFVEDDNGTTIVFVVRESRSYDPSADTLDIFSSDDEKAHLNIITCEGIWNKDSKSYSSRLVVFTDKK